MLYLDDIELEKVDTAGPYLLTEEEIVEFSARWDPFPFHTDKDEADASVFGGVAASAVHLICIANRLLHDTDVYAVRAALAHEFRYPNPGRAGDSLTVETRAVDKKVTQSRPNVGIVEQRTRLINQAGTVVLEMSSTLMVWKQMA